MITGIILAGGKGLRMGGPLPKQYLPFAGKPIACHSVDVFLAHPLIAQVIVVAAEEYHSFFTSVDFAEPGERRQDSLFNGLMRARHEWICVHDAARPFLTEELLTRLIQEGFETGAATLAMPVKNTLKECDAHGFVRNTPERSLMWEVQTPQMVSKAILERGFAHAHAHHITVTDDVSLAELVGHPVKLVKGSYQNIKITTPEDLLICQNISSSSPMTALAT